MQLPLPGCPIAGASCEDCCVPKGTSGSVMRSWFPAQSVGAVRGESGRGTRLPRTVSGPAVSSTDRSRSPGTVNVLTGEHASAVPRVTAVSPELPRALPVRFTPVPAAGLPVPCTGSVLVLDGTGGTACAALRACVPLIGLCSTILSQVASKVVSGAVGVQQDGQRLLTNSRVLAAVPQT